MAVEEPVFTVSSHSITSITSTAVEISLSGSWAERQISGSLGVGVLMVNLQDGSDIINGSVSYAAMSGNTTATVTASGLTPGATYAIPECAGNIFYDNARLNIPTRIEFTAVPPTPVEDESYLNKRGLTHFWENIDDIKQNKLTAGAGISITNDVISATGGGTADAVDWGHITGSMSNQTDLTTALNAKANTADLAAVATSGSYNDLSNKPTIGNATLTIQKNGTSAGTFTANATSNKTINITVPTTAADVSALPASTKYGASIAVSINTTDYKVTTTLKDQDGNTLGTAQVIDLPLESVVVNGSYDSTNKKIVLTLQSGSTIDIPVGDLIAGLQSEITSTNKLASDLVDDTNQTHKFMTSAEKTKLSGIAAGAEVNVQSDWNQTTTTADDYIKNKPTKVSDFTNDAGYITSYTDTQVTQTRVDPSEITTFYPVASTTSYTNTGDVKKFGAVKLKCASDDGGTAELELGQNSYNDPVGGALTLWNMGTSQYKTTLQRSLGASNQTFYFPYNADSTSGTLIANGAATAGTGSATNPVYADRYGILHATTYALNKTVPSDAVFTDTTYRDATTSAAGLMSASDKTKLNGIASGAEVNVQSDWNVTSTSSDAFIKNKPTIPTTTSQLTNDSGFITDAGVTSFNGSTGAVTYTAPVTSVNGNTGAVTGLQTISNLVTSVSSSSTNSQYPSAKLFYDTVGDVESVLQTLNSGSGAA